MRSSSLSHGVPEEEACLLCRPRCSCSTSWVLFSFSILAVTLRTCEPPIRSQESPCCPRPCQTHPFPFSSRHYRSLHSIPRPPLLAEDVPGRKGSICRSIR